MADINYRTEKCWSIKEDRPIEVKKIKNRYGEWRIIFEPMTIKYETWQDIVMNILPNRTYGLRYNYADGVANMCVTDEGLKDLEKLTDILKIK